MKAFFGKSSTKKKAVILIVAAICIVCVGGRIFAGAKENTEEEILWREYPVSMGDVTASLDGSGLMEATGVNHSFDVDLTLEEVVVAVGQEVKQGDVLAHYLKEELKDTLAQEQRELADAKRNLEEVKNAKVKGDLEKSLTTADEKRVAESTYLEKKKEIEKAIALGEKKIEKQKSTITDLEKQLADAKASEDGATNHQGDAYVKQKKELERLQEELEQLQEKEKVVDNSSEMNALSAQRDLLQEQVNAIQEQIDGADPTDTEGIAALEKEKNRLQGEISTVSSRISTLWDAHGSGSDETAITGLQKKITELQDKMKNDSSKEVAVKKFEEDVKTAKEALETLEEEKLEQETNLETLENSRTEDLLIEEEKAVTKEELVALNERSYNNSILKAEAEVAKCMKQVQEIEGLLKTPVLVAKTDGVVTKVNFSGGEKVLAGKSVVVIGDTGEKQVIAQISQEDIGSIAVGQKVEMQFVAQPDATLVGTVKEKSLVPTEEGDGVKYRVGITLDDENEELLQGMTCGVKFILKKVENVLTLSNKAIRLVEGKQVVTVLLPDGSHEERQIKTGFSDGRTSEIKSGLQDGDIVVVAG